MMLNHDALTNNATVGELGKRYLLSSAARLSEETAYRNLGPSVATLVGYLGEMRISQITEERADAYSIYLSENFKRNTVRHKLTIARSVFKYAVGLKIISENPFNALKLPRKEKTARLLDDKLILQLLDLLLPHYRRAFILALFTGMRRSEVVYLDWSEIFPTYIRLPAARTKSGKERIIPIGKNVWRILGCRGQGRLFHFRAETFTAYVVKAWHKIGKGRVRIHDCRGTALTKFLEAGGDTRAAMEIFGWDHETSMEPYHHITFQRVKPLLNIQYRGL